MRLVSGLDLEGSGTVASSTPVRFSVSLTDAPGSPSYDEWIGWETSEVKTVPEAIVDDDHETGDRTGVRNRCVQGVGKGVATVAPESAGSAVQGARHPRMYPQLGAGGLHVFASAGSPVGTRPTGARSRTTSSRSAQLYDGARFFWAVPDYVPADQVAALPGLVRPEVTERMATLVVQGTTPGRAADHAL